MTDPDPRPLLDPSSGASPLLRGALQAARAEVPGGDALARLAARLPLVSPPTGAGPPGEAPAGGPQALPGAASSSVAAAAATPSVLSGALVGAALGVLVAGAGFFWQATPTKPRAAPDRGDVAVAARALPREAAVGSARASLAGAESALAAAPLATAVPREGALPPRPARPGAPMASSARASEAEVPAAPSAGEPTATSAEAETEAHLLQRAQDALGASPAQALALTGEHASRFPSGALGQEREVVAIQALVKLGRASEARARAARFEAAFPGSAHRRRLDALLAP